MMISSNCVDTWQRLLPDTSFGFYALMFSYSFCYAASELTELMLTLESTRQTDLRVFLSPHQLDIQIVPIPYTRKHGNSRLASLVGITVRETGVGKLGWPGNFTGFDTQKFAFSYSYTHNHRNSQDRVGLQQKTVRDFEKRNIFFTYLNLCRRPLSHGTEFSNFFEESGTGYLNPVNRSPLQLVSLFLEYRL